MKKLIYILTIVSFFVPCITKALDNSKIATSIKYYKTITYYNNNILDSTNKNVLSIDKEITKEEYDNAKETEISTMANVTIETSYKRMITSISENGKTFRYMVNMDWKTIPSTRSYDIIGVGHNSNVKISGTPQFRMTYCYSAGGCNTTYTANHQSFAKGAGASFKLPSGSINSLVINYYYDVAKNVDATILTQYAFGDYSHATSSVSESASKKYKVSNAGIELDSSIFNDYDNINTGQATWSGSW